MRTTNKPRLKNAEKNRAHTYANKYAFLGDSILICQHYYMIIYRFILYVFILLYYIVFRNCNRAPLLIKYNIMPCGQNNNLFRRRREFFCSIFAIFFLSYIRCAGGLFIFFVAAENNKPYYCAVAIPKYGIVCMQNPVGNI